MESLKTKINYEGASFKTINKSQSYNSDLDNTVNTSINNSNTEIESYDFDDELANNDGGTIKITQTTLKVPASFPNNEEQQTQQLDIKPNSTYSDFFDEHGNSGSYTYGVDQNILSDLKSGNVGLYKYSLSDILYDPSIEEKSLAEFLQENGNLSTAEQGQAFADAIITGEINTNDINFISSLILYIAEASSQVSEEEITQRLVKLCSSMNENSKFTNLVNKLKDKGFSEKDAVFIIENLNSIGACSYASTSNAIFSLFMNNPEQFQMVFGFPMYDQDGTFNGEELILDLYLFANSVENGGGLFIQDRNDPNKMNVIYDENDISQTMMNQITLTTAYGIYEWILDDYLKSKGTSLTFSCNSTPNVSDGQTVIEIVQDALANGEAVSIGLHPKSENMPIFMTKIKDDGTKGLSTINGGHSVFVTGITETGEIIISSWGEKFILSAADLNASDTTINEIQIINSIIQQTNIYN